MAIPVQASQNDVTPLWVRSLSAANIAELSLRKVKTFSPNDEAADPDELDIALQFMDLIVAEVTGTMRCYWLSPATVTFDWPAASASVALSDQMGAGYPPTGIQFPVRAWLVDAVTGQRQYELELCRRKKYEDRLRHDTNGNPQLLFIDRQVNGELAYVWPVPQAPDPASPTVSGWKIALEFQTYTRSVLGVQGGDQAGEVSHGFSQEWQLYLVTRVAIDIGDGPVTDVGVGKLNEWRSQAAEKFSLLIYANKEKTNRRPVTRRYGG